MRIKDARTFGHPERPSERAMRLSESKLQESLTPAQKKVSDETLDSLGKEEKPDGHGNYKSTVPLFNMPDVLDDSWDRVVEEITKENEG